MVARFVRDEEVVGSNPATPTQVRGPFLAMRDGPRGVGAARMSQGAARQELSTLSWSFGAGCAYRCVVA